MINGIGNRVFIMGIGGISLSAIAVILKKNGHIVCGYDQTESETTKNLQQLGITIAFKKVFSEEYDTVIYSSAFSDEDALLTEFRNKNIQVICRAQALEIISKDYSSVVAVAGSHGKTTTTSIISSSLKKAGTDFTAHIGGVLKEWDSNVIIGEKRELLVTEACEYKRSFHHLNPSIGVILNLDLDHIDIYQGEDEIVDAYIQFAENIRLKGCLILNIDDKNAIKIIDKLAKKIKIITYSIKSNLADYYIELVEENNGRVKLSVNTKTGLKEKFEISFSGEHYLYNFLASFIVLNELGIEINKIKQGFLDFKGVKRRNEVIGNINGSEVVLDYAHHPVELDRVIKSTKARTTGKVFVVFQSHTYSRTKFFWKEFIASLSNADSVVLYPIYPAREKAIKGITAKRMAEDLRRIKTPCYYSESLDKIITYLSYFVSKEDKVLILGAGDIDKIRNLIK